MRGCRQILMAHRYGKIIATIYEQIVIISLIDGKFLFTLK